MGLFENEKKIVIHDYEEGLLYKNGEFCKILKKGVYNASKKGFKTEIVVIDRRIQSLIITGQEILTKDKLNVRVNILVRFRVNDAVKAKHEVESYSTSVYQDVQMVIRGIVGNRDLDELVLIKNIFDDEIKQEFHAKCEKYGISIESVEFKDIILPGNLKAILLKEIEAKKESDVALIKARSEVAQTRALLNAANLVKEHPEILELKLLESFEKLAEHGNSVVLPLPSGIFEKYKSGSI